MPSKFTTVRLRTKTRNRIDRTRKMLAGRHRKMTLSDAAELAFDALDLLPPDQREQLVNTGKVETESVSD